MKRIVLAISATVAAATLLSACVYDRGYYRNGYRYRDGYYSRYDRDDYGRYDRRYRDRDDYYYRRGY